MPRPTLGEVISCPTWTYLWQLTKWKECLDDACVHVTAVCRHEYRWTLLRQAFSVVHLALTFFPNQRPEIEHIYSHADVDQVGLIGQLMKLEVYCLKDLSQKCIGHGYLRIVVWVAEFCSVAI